METIYLDHASTTAVRPEAREAYLEALDVAWGNPSSVHAGGRASRRALEEARERVASVLGAERNEIVFTGSGTESDNLAVLGRWRAERRGAVACTAVEHRAVLDAVAAASREGAEPVILGVDVAGRVQLDALDEALAEPVAIVSVMWANNELGTLQPVAEAAERCRAAGVTFHTDAVQAFGRVRVRVDEVGCDLLSLSGHKLGAPKGIGALYIRSGTELEPLVHGGGQERGVRSGTENVAGAVAFARAVELAAEELDRESDRLGRLRDRLESGLRAAVPDLVVHAEKAARLPHISNVSIPAEDAGALLAALDFEGLAVSSGSACRSGSTGPSHVLIAAGLDAEGRAPVRFSLGRETGEADIEAAIEIVARVAERVGALYGEDR